MTYINLNDIKICILFSLYTVTVNDIICLSHVGSHWLPFSKNFTNPRGKFCQFDDVNAVWLSLCTNKT